jgi:hypothetical protein
MHPDVATVAPLLRPANDNRRLFSLAEWDRLLEPSKIAIGGAQAQERQANGHRG